MILAGCKSDDNVEPISQEQASLIKNLPYSTQFLLYVNSAELNNKGYNESNIVNTNSFTKITSIFKKFEYGTGLTLEGSLKELYVANSWEEKDCILIVLDKNQEKIFDFLKNQNAFESIKVDNKYIYKEKNDSINRYYHIFNKDVLMIADDSSFIANRINNKNKSLSSNNNFMDIINGVKYKKHYWTASNQGKFLSLLMQQFLSTRKAGYVRDFAKNIDNVSVSALFGNEIALNSSMGCKDAKTSFLLTNAVRSAISMDLFAQNNPELGNIFEKIDVQRNGKKVNFDLELNQSELKEIKTYILKRKPEKK